MGTYHDTVNHPSHYTKGKIEVWDFISDQQLNFDRGSAIKYICRAGSKDPAAEIQDLEKAIQFINHEIKVLKWGKILMNANEYQVLASRTINMDLSLEDQLYHALHGIVGEVGEIHSIFQKAYQGHDIDNEHLKKEIGDLLWFIAELCTSSRWDLSEIMEMNINKLMERYPDGFDVEHSIHRKEGDI